MAATVSSSTAGKIDYTTANDAFAIFAEKKELVFNVNRQKSLLKLPKSIAGTLRISRQFHDMCMRETTSNTKELGQFFFRDLQGNIRYMNQATVDQFTRFTKEAFPDLNFTRRFAVVDTASDIELIPHEKLPYGYATVESDGLSVALKVSAYVVKLIPPNQLPTPSCPDAPAVAASAPQNLPNSAKPPLVTVYDAPKNQQGECAKIIFDSVAEARAFKEACNNRGIKDFMSWELDDNDVKCQLFYSQIPTYLKAFSKEEITKKIQAFIEQSRTPA